MMILYITAIVGIANLLLFHLTAQVGEEEFRRKYPNMSVPKLSFAKQFLNVSRAVIVSFLPFFNILIMWTLVFKNGDLVAGSVDDILKQCQQDNVTFEEK